MTGKRNRKPLKQVTDINDYRRSHPRLRTVKYEWVECEYVTYVEGVLGISPGIYEFDSKGTVTYHNPSKGGTPENIGRNFFTEVAPALRDYLGRYCELFSDEEIERHKIESDDTDIEFVKALDMITAIVHRKTLGHKGGAR